MIFKRTMCLLLAAVCALCLAGAVAAAEVDCDSRYCFSGEDFSDGEALSGICITGLPASSAGTVMLGTRVVRAGDILTAQQLEQLTFQPLRTEDDLDVTVTYLPIYKNRVAPATTMTISIRGKEDKAPVAEDSALETYKNLANSGKLKASDPEGGSLTYTITRNPKRGEVTIHEDGTFTYMPKKNKVGTDSFTYTATDTAGNVSREATVTIQVLKTTNKPTYSDTIGRSCRFAAEWMKNTGLFIGETIGGEACFRPDRTVTRGEFVTMLVQSLGIPVDRDATCTGFTDEAPAWLKPYLAAALRAGLTAGWQGGTVFGAEQPITGAEAALMLQNALDLPVSATDQYADAPEWAVSALCVMADHGIALEADSPLTRSQTAEALYRASRLAQTAPGMAVFAKQ